MAPVTRNDIVADAHTSSAEDRRGSTSESAQPTPNSDRISQSPAPSMHKSKCESCGEFFETANGDEESLRAALKEHIAAVHPHIAKSSLDDPAAGGANDSEAHESESVAAKDAKAKNVEGTPDIGAEDNGEARLANQGHAESHRETEAEVESYRHHLSAPFISIHGTPAEQIIASVEQRAHQYWNLHDVQRFSSGYEDETKDLDELWDLMHSGSNHPRKRDSDEFGDRPTPYKKTKVARGEFLEITPVTDILAHLRDPELRSHDELYAITANVAHTLKVWQAEYMAIDKLTKLATRSASKQTANPRKPEQPAVFEDKKESILYGYKYDPKQEKISNQDPFVQGGFKATPAQQRKMDEKVNRGDPNPDGWPVLSRFGVDCIPKFQNPPKEEESVSKNTRKRKAAELEAARAAEAASRATPNPSITTVDTQQDLHAHQGPPSKRQRTRGGRQGATAEAPTSDNTAASAEADTTPGTPGSTPGPSSAPYRGSTRGRGGRGGRAGRGQRGRGASRALSRALPQTDGAQDTPATAPDTPTTSTRGRGQGRTSTLPGTTNTPPPIQARPATATCTVSQPAPIAPAPSNNTQGQGSGSSTVLMSTAPNESLDPAELIRRQKIANSKNPKRTEAMLNHWERFIAAGRIRNPKRSKEEIEAARADEAARKAAEGPKVGGRKRKSAATEAAKKHNIETAVAPAVQLAPALTTGVEPATVSAVTLQPSHSLTTTAQQTPVQTVQSHADIFGASHASAQHAPIQTTPTGPQAPTHPSHVQGSHSQTHLAPGHRNQLPPVQPAHSQAPHAQASTVQHTFAQSTHAQPAPVQPAPVQPPHLQTAGPIHPARHLAPQPAHLFPHHTPNSLPPSLSPYAPIDPRVVGRPPYDPARPNGLHGPPFPPTHPLPHPPHQPHYQTVYPPYPEYYLHYGRPSLPRPGNSHGHPRP